MPIDPMLTALAVDTGKTVLNAGLNTWSTNKENRVNLGYYNMQRQDALARSKSTRLNSSHLDLSRMPSSA